MFGARNIEHGRRRRAYTLPVTNVARLVKLVGEVTRDYIGPTVYIISGGNVATGRRRSAVHAVSPAVSSASSVRQQVATSDSAVRGTAARRAELYSVQPRSAVWSRCTVAIHRMSDFMLTAARPPTSSICPFMQKHGQQLLTCDSRRLMCNIVYSTYYVVGGCIL